MLSFFVLVTLFNTLPAVLSTNNHLRTSNAILPDTKHMEFYAKYQAWDGSAKILHHFDDQILKPNRILPNALLLPSLFKACKITGNYEFAAKAWDYVSDTRQQHIIEEPNQLIFSQLLHLYTSQSPTISVLNTKRCVSLVQQWQERYKSNHFTLFTNIPSHLNISGVSFLNEFIGMILTKFNWNEENQQRGIQVVWRLMIQLNISPNDETLELVRSANGTFANFAQNRNENTPQKLQNLDDCSDFEVSKARLVITDSMEKSFKVPLNSWEDTLQGNDRMIALFYETVIFKNVVLKDSSIIIPLLDRATDVKIANDVWNYVSSKNPVNCLSPPINAVYVKYIKVLRQSIKQPAEAIDVMGIYNTAQETLNEWVHQYMANEESLKFKRTPWISDSGIFVQIILLIQEIPGCLMNRDAKKVQIKSLCTKMIDLKIKDAFDMDW